MKVRITYSLWASLYIQQTCDKNILYYYFMSHNQTNAKVLYYFWEKIYNYAIPKGFIKANVFNQILIYTPIF